MKTQSSLAATGLPRTTVGRSSSACGSRLLPLLLLLAVPLVAHAQFSFLIMDGTVTITGYTGPGGDVVVPSTRGGLPVTSIRAAAFQNCVSLTSVTIPEGVTSIGNYAFGGCSSLIGIQFPESLTDIAEGLFSGCTGLTSVEIPESVTSIGSFAFGGCTGLTSITIPASVTNVGYAVFAGCGSLSTIEVDALNGSYTSANGVLYDHGQTSLIECPARESGSYTIPDTVTRIGEWAFAGCSSLTNVAIPDSVVSIGDSAFQGAGLTSIRIPESVTSIGEGAFVGCGGLTEVIIPTSVTNSLSCFYDCTNLTSVTIGNGVTSIGDGAFFQCTSLDSITIPASVTSLGAWVFDGCTSLTGIYFEGNAPSLGGGFGDVSATVYYLRGTWGWGPDYGGCPTFPYVPELTLTLQVYPGLTITGEIGKIYSIEYVTDLTDPTESDWRCLEYLQLPASRYLWADQSTPATAKRYYRAVTMEAPTNMVFIPAGTFRMGSPEDEVDRQDNEGPQTAVTISRGFWMGKYEVTQGEYLEVMGNNPSRFNGVQGGTDYGVDLTRPVEGVRWTDALDYCYALTLRERATGRIRPNSAYRLPTEAEWEYACRAWTSTRFSYGDDPDGTDLTNYAWYGDNSAGQTHPVGKKLPNPWGLYDMYANVWERCQWNHQYHGGIVLDPQGLDGGWGRVVRGGTWSTGVEGCRSASRQFEGMAGGYPYGFRVVLAPDEP